MADGPADVRTVLVVEDDATIGRRIVDGLDCHGYRAVWARSGQAGLDLASRMRPDVVLLDLGLPDGDGLDLLHRLRRDDPDLLLIIMTARSAELDVIVGLDAGADDYLTKPFELSVLLARLRAHLRRRTRDRDDRARSVVGPLVVDGDSRRCRLGGHELALRPKEYDLLVALVSRPGVAVSREDLMSEVWDENWFGSTKTLDVTIASLRRRLDCAAEAAGLAVATVPRIHTLRGFGYRLDPPRGSSN